jgi:putative oxidoreductase
MTPSKARSNSCCTKPARQTDAVYLLLRVLTGLMFSFHGVQKIFGLSPLISRRSARRLVGGKSRSSRAPLPLNWTSCAAFVASGTMAVAYLQFHWRFAFGKEFFPAINKGELAVVYALVFLYIACRGGGRFSVDALRARKAES